MKYSLIACTNGNFAVKSEHGENKQAAMVAFHKLCETYWNAPDVTSAMIKVVDENLDTVDGKMEYITHDVQPVIEPVVEPVEEESEEES